MAKVYSGDVGVQFIVDCGENITGATNTSLKVKRPDKTEVEWSATIHESNYLTYTTISGDLEQVGKYYIQASLSLGVWTGLGETAELIIHDDYK